MRAHLSLPTPRHLRGAALLESLLAFVFLAVGTIAAGQLQGSLRLHADVARQRSEAVRLGERELEGLRAYSSIGAASGSHAYATIVDADTVIDASSGYASNTSYRIVRRIDDTALTGAKAASISVEWLDRTGASQHIVLDSVIAGNDPAYSGALALGRSHAFDGAFGRSALVPGAARSLGHGQSAWKPSPSGSVALVFDDAGGRIVSRCSGVTAATRDLAAGDLTTCEAGAWLLLSGIVRFSDAMPPAAASASAVPPAFAMALTLADSSGEAPAQCSVDAMKTVRYVAAGSLHIDAVPIDAAPASAGLSTWDDTGDRFAAYRCIVTPRADGRWSGRTTLLPVDWTIGNGAADRRVCRFASDRDGSGAIDANIEHPADYHDVAAGLTEQNFLVVRGNQACPTASGDVGTLAASLATVQHQP
jgi:Tfp pilus assembly protein PilV